MKVTTIEELYNQMNHLRSLLPEGDETLVDL